MTTKRVIIICSVPLLLILLPVIAYMLTRDTVRVTDAVSGLPIRDARVVPIYPSFNGAPYLTDRRGVARIGGFGLPRGGYGVQVSAAGYFTNLLITSSTATNHSDWTGDHMDVSLQPVLRP